MKRPAVSLIALLSCVATASAAPSELIMFGDSLSDVGNVWDQTFHLAPQSPPYFNGRYSNGVLWGERLAADLEITVPTPSRLSGRNFYGLGRRERFHRWSDQPFYSRKQHRQPRDGACQRGGQAVYRAQSAAAGRNSAFSRHREPNRHEFAQRTVQ